MTPVVPGAVTPSWLRGFPAAVVAVSSRGEVMVSNGRLEDLTGREVVGGRLEEVLDEGSWSKWRRLLEAPRSEGEAGRRTEMVLVTADGLLELRRFVVVPDDGAEEGVRWLIELPEDPASAAVVPELARLNAELVARQRDLTRQRVALARALEREAEARAAADGALEARQNLLAVVAHDLRSPLHTLTLGIDLLRRSDLSAARRERHLGMMGRAARSASALVQDLVDVAVIESGGLPVELAPVCADELLRELGETFRPQAKQRRLQLTVRLRAGAEPVLADHGRLEQALTNLLDNALKFTPEEGTVRLAADPDPLGVRLSVGDDGPGIDEADLPHLFDRYWQAKRTPSGGLGLGLTIAHGIIEAHGSRLTVESRPGEGTTFAFTLPHHRARRASEPT